jgi:hypothetical protein
MLLAKRYLSILAINLLVLIFAFILDSILEPLSPAAQLFVQVPLLVLAVDEFRRWTLTQSTWVGLSKADINGAFFFASPLAALGSDTLLNDIRSLMPFGNLKVWN